MTEVTQANEALVAGGVGSANQFLRSAAVVQSSGATLTTDKSDYPPGSVVDIFGANWQPGETVSITIHEDPPAYPDPVYSVVADSVGGFINMSFSPTPSDVGRTFTVTAVGQSSGFVAQTTFTDSANVTVTITSPTAGTPVTLTSLPATVTINFNYSTITTTGTNVTADATVSGMSLTFSAVTKTGLAAGDNKLDSISVTIPATAPNGNYAVKVVVTDTTANKSGNDNRNNAVVVAVQPTQLVFTTSPFQTITPGDCSPAIFVQTRDANGPRSPTSTLTVNLSSSSGTGTFYTASNCAPSQQIPPKALPTITPNSGNATSDGFFYKDTTPGTPIITASTTPSPTLTAAQQETIGTLQAITVTTSPAGRQITVDGTDYAAPQTFSFVVGTSHTLSVTSPQSGGAGSQFVWTSWSDGGGQSHSITVPSTPTTYTANFKTQFQVTFDASANVKADGTGTIVTVDASAKTASDLPVSEFVASSASVTYSYTSPVTTAAATKQYRWTSTSGLLQTLQTNTLAHSTALTSPATYTAQFQVTFDASANVKADGTGTIVTVDASAKTASDLPFSKFVDSGASVTYSYTSPVTTAAATKQYRWTIGRASCRARE